MSGAISYHAGLAAEASVERLYDRVGYAVAARRWRGAAGEIDLIMRQGGQVIFIEVKQSSTHALAAEHLSGRQMARIYDAAGEFLAGEPAGLATESRFDVALVNGTGQIEVLENAFAA